MAFPLLLVFFFSSRVKLSHTKDSSTSSFLLHIWEFAVGICRENLPWLSAAGVCRDYLPWEFVMAISGSNLPWEFAAGICRGYLPWVFCIHKPILFCICEQILFIWKQTFFICEQTFLICVWQCFFLLLPWQLWATATIK